LKRNFKSPEFSGKFEAKKAKMDANWQQMLCDIASKVNVLDSIKQNVNILEEK